MTEAIAIDKNDKFPVKYCFMDLFLSRSYLPKGNPWPPIKNHFNHRRYFALVVIVKKQTLLEVIENIEKSVINFNLNYASALTDPARQFTMPRMRKQYMSDETWSQNHSMWETVPHTMYQNFQGLIGRPYGIL